MSDIAKVNGLTAFAEKQESVKDLEEFGAGLMNPACKVREARMRQFGETNVQRMAWPLSAKWRKKATRDQAL